MAFKQRDYSPVTQEMADQYLFGGGMSQEAMLDQQHEAAMQQGYDFSPYNPASGQGNLISTTTSQHPTVVHEQVDNRDVIRDIELRLRGYDKDLTNNRWIRVGEPLIDERGMHKLLITIRSHLDKVGRLTDLKDEEIYVMMKLLAKDVADFLVTTHKKHNVEVDSFSTISNAICNPIFLNLKASRDGRQLDAISIQSKLVQTPTQNKQGFLKRTFGI